MKQAIDLARETLVKPFEGYHVKQPDGGCKSYPDPGTGGLPWTIGWGSTGKGINQDTYWTLEQAETALNHDLERFARGVLDLSPELLDEPPRRLAALISFSYNCGLRNYKISTLRKRVNEKDWVGASTEILRWNKAAGRVLPGLTRRRKMESLLLQ